MKSGISRRHAIAAGFGLAGLPTLAANAAGRTERLQITKVEVFKVVVPMQEDIISSPELGPDGLTEFPSLHKFILKVHTDSGIFGVGETSRQLPEDAVRRNAEFVTGKNIFDMNLSRLELPSGAGYGGFETAFYDAVGKALGWPVWRFLGGKAQSKVLVNYWCGRKNPTDIRRVAERALKGQFQGIKVKGRTGDPIVKAVAAVKEVAPALKITVDFNSHYKTEAEFMPIGKGLDDLGNVMVMEDPIVKDDMQAYRRLRARFKTPVALHLGSPKAMIRAIQADACAMFNTGPAPSMMSFVQNAYLAGAAGIPVWHGSGHELGILDAAMLHSCAAAPNCTLPSDILSYQRVDDLLVNPIEIRESYATVPDLPGLGFQLDEDAVKRYAVS